jgi:hypothetical protein
LKAIKPASIDLLLVGDGEGPPSPAFMVGISPGPPFPMHRVANAMHACDAHRLLALLLKEPFDSRAPTANRNAFCSTVNWPDE